MRSKLIIAIGCIAATLGACATYKTTLSNEQGQTITCEASGISLMIAGNHLRKGFERCLESAKGRGFKEVAPNTSVSK